MKKITCDHLYGRLREICEGSDISGHPIDMDQEKRLEYLRVLFPQETEETLIAHVTLPRETEAARFGLGDLVAAGIKIATFGKVEPCGSCNKRKDWLNSLLSFPRIDSRKAKDTGEPRPRGAPTPLPASVTEGTPRNLIMHIWPTGNGAWQWNLDQLIRRRHLFTGKIVIGVAVGPNTATMEEVQEYARPLGSDIEVFSVPNNPRIREGATFLRLLESVSSVKDSITFFCHSKGARHVEAFGNDGSTIHQWVEAMYVSCLDQIGSVLQQLSSYPMVGPFRRFGNFKTPGNYRWHYSGAFYWFRNTDVFERNWQTMDKLFFAVESWPGLMFKPEEVACCFVDDCGDLYKMDYWKSHIQPQINSLMERVLK